MGKETEILWTDSTFNPWWGCRKIAPGCDNCYAEKLDHRLGNFHWEISAKYRIMSDKYWVQPVKWNGDAIWSTKPHRVFCGSMCDWADPRAPQDQRERLWKLIKETPMLDWQLLTKRAGNIEKYLPKDWGSGYDNVWLGVTVEDRKHGFPRIKTLRDIPAKIRFLSVEPLLEDLEYINLNGINWVIVGGESGPGARPMNRSWANGVWSHCKMQKVPFFFKQWGRKDNDGADPTQNKGGNLLIDETYLEFPKDSR